MPWIVTVVGEALWLIGIAATAGRGAPLVSAVGAEEEEDMGQPERQLQVERTGAPTSLIDELIEEHEQIHVLFDSFVVAETEDKAAVLQELVSAISKHEVAEEVVVYPAARRLGAAGGQILDVRLGEQAALEVMLDQLEHEEIGTAAFESVFAHLERNVHLHTAYEERTLLEPLRHAVSDEQLVDLAEQYAAVRAVAPSHPYPADGDGSRTTTREQVRSRLLVLLRGIRDRLQWSAVARR